MNLMEEAGENLLRPCAVERNKGTAVVDRMETKSLRPSLMNN
jgi:hypothetical protein